MLTGYDLDLTRQTTQTTQTSNRIRGLFAQVHPPLERILRLRLENDAVLEILATWFTAALLKHAGKARIDAKLNKLGARRHTAWTSDILAALEKQTFTVVGIDAAGQIIPRLARQLVSLHAQRKDVATHMEFMVESHQRLIVLFAMIRDGALYDVLELKIA